MRPYGPEKRIGPMSEDIRFFDSHAHINEDSFTEEEREALITALGEHSEIAHIADIGYNIPSSRQAVADAARLAKAVAVVGVHPHDSRSMREQSIRELEVLAREPKVRAIGETGLDYHYMLSPREDQILWFRRQIRLANELGMPIVVHSREADGETMEILKEEGAFSAERLSLFPGRPGPEGSERPDARVYLHCFSGSAEMAAEYVRLGAMIGICGPLTYKNNKKTLRVAERIPIEYMMAETDSPYLTPEPMRGRPNRPWYIRYTVMRLAEIKGLTPAQAAEATYINACRFYGLETK